MNIISKLGFKLWHNVAFQMGVFVFVLIARQARYFPEPFNHILDGLNDDLMLLFSGLQGATSIVAHVTSPDGSKFNTQPPAPDREETTPE